MLRNRIRTRKCVRPIVEFLGHVLTRLFLAHTWLYTLYNIHAGVILVTVSQLIHIDLYHRYTISHRSTKNLLLHKFSELLVLT